MDPLARQFAAENREYLEKHRPEIFADLQRRGDLNKWTSSVGEEADQKFEQLMMRGSQNKEMHSLPHLERVQRLRDLQEEAMEIVRDEIVLQPRD